MTSRGVPNLYAYLGVTPDCPDLELHAALDRALALEPPPHWLGYAESVLRDPRRRGYYNAHHGLPSAPGRPGRAAPGTLLPAAHQRLERSEAALVTRRAPADPGIHQSPVAGLLETEWPLAIPLPGGEVLRPPFPFVDLCHPNAVGRIEPDWVPPRLFEMHDDQVPGQALLALLFPLRSDVHEAGSPDVWVKVTACDEAGAFSTARGDALIRDTLAFTGAAQAIACDERLTKNRRVVRVELYKCTGRYRIGGFIRSRVLAQSIVASFASTDQRYTYAIRELFNTL
jgi:hypothetical protein